ncbi:MAG: DMT family transporter [Timaviella obliquedivisa GSE-PSE-MK23-08B]|jgi:drug/metabolite transporter (DMT)-like permease|nr:DMT family transporter [Timaviella obliquedivisa GSE-PSE-MK23-08B]
MRLHQSSGRWRLGLSLALVTVSLWGVLPIALKVVLQAVDVYTVTWFRFLVSFWLLAIYLGVKGELSTGRRKLGKTRLDLLAIATLFLAANYLFYLKGLQDTSPSNAQVIIQLAPVMMGIGGLIIFKERYTLQQWGALGTLLLGMLLFFNEQLQHLATAPTQFLWGSVYIVIAAAVWAIYALAQKQLLQQVPSSIIMLVIYGGGALLFAPFTSPASLQTLTPLQWGMLLFSALNTFVAYGAFAEALDHWEASKVSAVLSTTPIVTLSAVFLVSWLFPTLIPSEPITFLAVTGAFFVVVGSLGIAMGRRSSQ